MGYIDVENLSVIYSLSENFIKAISDSESAEKLLQQFTASKNKLDMLHEKNFLEEKLREAIDRERSRFEEEREVRIYAVDGLNLSVEKGEFLSIVGESGSGKSTLALSLVGVLPSNAKYRGRIFIEGNDILSMPEEKKRVYRAKKIGYIGEISKKYLNPMMYNAIQVLESAYVATEDIDEAVNRTKKAAKISGLEKRILTALPEQLSMGQISKLGYAMAIAKNPEIIIADEPFRSLDIYQATTLARTLKRISEEFNTTTIMFTHRIDIALDVSEQVAVMYRGKIVEKGQAEKIYRKPIHPFTKGLIGAIPDIRRPKKRLVSIPGETIPNVVSLDMCPFFNRCPVMIDRCVQKMPEQREIDGRKVACYRAEEIADQPPEEFWKET